MQYFKIFKYDNLYVGTVQVNSLHGINYTVSHEIRSRHINHKVCVVPFDVSTPFKEPLRLIEDRSAKWARVNKHDKLYISSKCRTNRDLFRNSGYKIVRDKQNADFIVYPATPTCYDIYTLYADVVAFQEATKTVYLFSLENEYGMSRSKVSFTDEDRVSVKEFLETNSGMTDVIVQEFSSTSKAYFMPECEEWAELLEDRKTRDNQGFLIRYMPETKIPLDLPIQITLETLQVWNNEHDDDLLAKAICQSNWQDYPATVCYFLKTHPSFYNSNVSNFKLIADQTGYNTSSSFSRIWGGRTVEPRDWNLLQDWLMLQLGVDANGGDISADKFNNMSFHLREIVLKRILVRPMHIDKPCNVNQLLSLVSN